MSDYVFGQKPVIKIPRTLFKRNQDIKTTFNEGSLIPFYVDEVLPGDSMKVLSNVVIRTTTPFIRPVMDSLFLDIYFFFVPNRIVDDRWEEVMGENKSGPWSPSVEWNAPVLSGSVVSGSIADYMGIPVNDYTHSTSGNYEYYFNENPFRAYAKIWNEWFRNENVQDPVNIITARSSVSQTNVNGLLNSNAWSANNFLGMPAPVSKIKDYFTSCLPEPQKGDAISIIMANDAPVLTGTDHDASVVGTGNQLRWASYGNGSSHAATATEFLGIGAANTSTLTYEIDPNAFNSTATGIVVPRNLWAKTKGLEVANVNDLRNAFALQRMLEKDARYGTRYVEILNGHFGVVSPDARLQRPEYLGGKRIPLNLQQIAQTSSTTEDSAIAQVSAYSLTNGIAGFNKGFVEHGYVIGVCCVRQLHTYQQGIARFWFRKKRTDFYDPVFANIGEQPVYKRELDCQASTVDPTEVFGYNEAWADYRFKPSMITGALRSAANQGLDIWHFGDKYASAPSLSPSFIQETPDFLDRTLSAPSTTIPQFVAEFFVKNDSIRPIPLYSYPGLVDHQ